MHYERAVNIYESIGRESSAKMVQFNIAALKSQHEDSGSELLEANELKHFRYMHERYVQSEGKQSKNAIETRINAANSLLRAGHGIKGESLSAKVVSISRRALGQEHDITKQVESCLEIVKQ